MIYVTGDLHGDLNWIKKSKGFKKLKKRDTLIVCGDFGFVWDGSAKELSTLKWLGSRKYNILFIDGTHDNLSILAGYQVVDYFGGKAHQVSGNCYHLLRGEIYRIEDNYIFAFGGGESPDMDVRTPEETWWSDELPSLKEIAYARENLESHRNVVDYIITHTPSATVHSFLNMDSQHTNQLLAFFDEISQNVKYKHWFFGCYHMDKVIPPLHHMVYQEVLPLKG